MLKRVIIIVFVLFIIFIMGYFYYTKVYMSDANILNRYLNSKGYSCIEEICSLEKDKVKYNMNINSKDFYVSNDKYNLSIGSNVPNLKLKSGNKKCIYQVEDYKIGDFITKDYSYDKECEQFIEEINNYIKEYGNILVESNVNY